MNRDIENRILDNVVNAAKLSHRSVGRFKGRAMKGGVVIEESGWSRNVLLSQWFDFLFSGVIGASDGIAGFLAGAGTANVSETDTSLQAYLGGGNDFQFAEVVSKTDAPRGTIVRVRIRAAEGAIVGNVGEVGLYRSNVTTTPAANRVLINHARLRDTAGNPTAVGVKSDEYFELECEIITYAIEGATGTLTVKIAGVPTDFDYEIRPINMLHIASWPNVSGFGSNNRTYAPTGIPSVATANQSMCYVTAETTFGDPGSSAQPAGYASTNRFATRVLDNYTAGSKQRLSTIRLPLNNGNIAAPGFRSININFAFGTAAWGTHQMLLDGPLQKIAGQVFDLPINVSMGNAP